MIMMVRDRGYSELRDSLEGFRVGVWTCNTCARLANVGGSDAAARLIEALNRDGVEAFSVGATSASCIEKKVREKLDNSKDPEVIVSLTCDVGAHCARRVSGKEVINPLVTIGPGYIDPEGRNISYVRNSDGTYDECPVEDVAKRMGMHCTPYV